MIVIIKTNYCNHEIYKTILILYNMVKKIFLFILALVIFHACGKKEENSSTSTPTTGQEATAPDTSSYDPERGEGKFDKVDVGATLDQAMATKGEEVAKVKCTSCHKPTEEKLVGPGWKGVTLRKKPEWIMNFITNPDPMIDKDPEIKAQLEICLVRMPNQQVTDEEARSIVEYMRKIDGVK